MPPAAPCAPKTRALKLAMAGGALGHGGAMGQKMAEAKTKPSGQDALAFLAALEPPERAAEGQRLAALFAEVTGFQPVLWGPSMVGFGRYSYRYDSGRSGESLATGFAFRGKEWALYLMAGEESALEAEIKALGPHRRGKACLSG